MENLSNPIYWAAVSKVLWEAIGYTVLLILFIGVPVRIAKEVVEWNHWIINGLNQAFKWITGVALALLVMFMSIIFAQIFTGNVRFNAIVDW